MNELLQSLKTKAAQRWALIPGERKRLILIAGIVGFIMVTSFVFDSGPAQGGPQEARPGQQQKLDMTVITAPRQEEGIDELRAQVSTLVQHLKQEQERTGELQKQVAELKNTSQERENRQVTELERDLRDTREELRAVRSEVLTSGVQSPAAKNLPPLPDPIERPEIDKASPPPKPKIVIMGGKTQTASKPLESSDPAVTTKPQSGSDNNSQNTTTAAGGKAINVRTGEMQFLPAGSIFRGALLNGVDAPTSSIAQKHPIPAVMRVKSLAFLPNQVSQDIRECHIILAFVGELASERAKARTETLSCIRNDGGVVETPIDGYAVGDDGKAGIGGQLVTKQGSLIARSLVAGTLSGFAQVMTPMQVPGINTSGGASWQNPDLNYAGTAGLMRGVNQAANEVSRFFLETAKEMHPVIEIPSQTEVTIVLVRGASLALSAGGNTKRSTFWNW